MLSGLKNPSLWGLLACLAPATAQIAYTESGSGMTFDMFSTTEGSNTDLHFNMSIPASNGWGAIGVGDQMVGALMFILLPDSTNGSTISVRSASGHIMPKPLTDVNFTVISGSSSNGNLMAEGICGGCQKWDSGTLNPTSTSQSFIWAVGPGTSGISGSGADAKIMQHSNMGTFNVDMTKAAQGASSGSSSGYSGSAGSSSSSSSSGGNSGVSGAMNIKAPNYMMVVAHATLLPLAFLIFYPLGVVLLRIPSLGWQAHALVQLVGTILVIAGMGVAISMSMSTYFGKFDTAHQGVGLTATSMMILQFFLGAAHHAGYSKFQRRWAVTYAHLTVGPIAMLLGAINPILGFILTKKMSAAIGVGVVGLLVVISSLVFAQVAQRKTTVKKAHGAGLADGHSSNSEHDEK